MTGAVRAIEIIAQADDAAIADRLEVYLHQALAESPAGIAISVPGGSTPFPILAELAKRRLDWPRITLWPGDDREVPESNPASNVGRIRALLEPVGALVQALTLEAQPTHFALVWLGMGADGHIASLFPSSDPQAGDPLAVRRIVPDPLPAEAPYARISLTIPALLNSDRLVFVVRGGEKQAMLEAALRGEGDWPVTRLLAAAQQAVTCFT